MDPPLVAGGSVEPGNFCGIDRTERVRLVREQHDIRRGRFHLRKPHPWVAPVAASAEDIFTAAQGKEVVGVCVRADAHPRIAPNRTKHALPRASPRCEGGVEGRLHGLHDVADRFLRSPEQGDLTQQHRAVANRSRIGHPNRDPGGTQSLDILAPVLLLIRDHEVGPEGENRRKVRVLRPAQLGQGSHPLRRVNTPVGDAHHALAQAEHKEGFCQARHERDDAPRLSRRTAAHASNATSRTPPSSRACATARPATEAGRAMRRCASRTRTSRTSPCKDTSTSSFRALARSKGRQVRPPRFRNRIGRTRVKTVAGSRSPYTCRASSRSCSSPTSSWGKRGAWKIGTGNEDSTSSSSRRSRSAQRAKYPSAARAGSWRFTTTASVATPYSDRYAKERLVSSTTTRAGFTTRRAVVRSPSRRICCTSSTSR